MNTEYTSTNPNPPEQLIKFTFHLPNGGFLIIDAPTRYRAFDYVRAQMIASNIVTEDTLYSWNSVREDEDAWTLEILPGSRQNVFSELFSEPQDISNAQLAKVKRSWMVFAKEEITVENIGGTWYAFGSELAMLRLGLKFKNFNVKYSSNRGTWFFSTEKV